MTYLLGKIFLCLVIAALIGAGAAWLLHRDIALRRERLINHDWRVRFERLDAERERATAQHNDALQTLKDRVAELETELVQPRQADAEQAIALKQQLAASAARIAVLERDNRELNAAVQNLAAPVRATASADPPVTEKDNLRAISGIGPVLERTLNSLGVFYLRQIANFGADDIARISGKLGTFGGRIERDRWVQQARALDAQNRGIAETKKGA